MSDVDTSGSHQTPEVASPWYRKDPTLVWAILGGLIAAWIFIAPIAFNQGALGAAYRESHLVGMVALTPYPQLYDDRVALYASAIITLILGSAVGLPLFLRRVLTWGSVSVLVAGLVLGLVLIFMWVPRYPWLWFTLAAVALLGCVCAAVELPGFRYLASPAGWIVRSPGARLIVGLVAMLELFLIVPAAAGAYTASIPPHLRNQPVYLLLYMKDRESPLHEEIVELVAATTDYFVVKLSEKVPHPKHDMGPATRPGSDDSEFIPLASGYLPMLLQRDSVDMVLPSIDPDFMIAEARRALSHFNLTTQPVFKVGREGGGVRVWTEYPASSPAPVSQPTSAP